MSRPENFASQKIFLIIIYNQALLPKKAPKKALHIKKDYLFQYIPKWFNFWTKRKLAHANIIENKSKIIFKALKLWTLQN